MANNLSNGTGPQDAPLSQAGDRWSRLRDLRRRLTLTQTGAQSDSPVSDVPATSSAAELTADSTAAEMPTDASDSDVAAGSPALDMHASASAPGRTDS